MTYPPFVILKLPLSETADLAPFVDACLSAGVKLIAVWGDGAATIEDHIDTLIINKGGFIATTAHSDDDSPYDLAPVYGTPTVISL